MIQNSTLIYQVLYLKEGGGGAVMVADAIHFARRKGTRSCDCLFTRADFLTIMKFTQGKLLKS